MLFEGQEPFEIHPVRPSPPVRTSSGPLIMAVLLVFAMGLGVLGVIFHEPIANVTKKWAIEAEDGARENEQQRDQRVLEQDVKILLKTLPERLQELKQKLRALDTECRSRLGVSLAQLRHHSSPRIDAAMLGSNACAESYMQFCNACVTERDFAEVDRVMARVELRLAQGSLDVVDRDDLEDLGDWIEVQLNTLSGQTILIGQLSEYLHQSL